MRWEDRVPMCLSHGTRDTIDAMVDDAVVANGSLLGVLREPFSFAKLDERLEGLVERALDSLVTERPLRIVQLREAR